MKSFISEKDIEQALLKKPGSAPFDYDLIICDSRQELIINTFVDFLKQNNLTK